MMLCRGDLCGVRPSGESLPNEGSLIGEVDIVAVGECTTARLADRVTVRLEEQRERRV